MKYEIKSWVDGKVLYSGDYGSLSECVVSAVKAKTNLFRANLSGAEE